MTRKLKLLTMSIITLFSLVTIPASSVEVEVIQEDLVEPQADIIDWLFETRNGVLYKRKYNFTKDRWEGPWIRV